MKRIKKVLIYIAIFIAIAFIPAYLAFGLEHILTVYAFSIIEKIIEIIYVLAVVLLIGWFVKACLERKFKMAFLKPFLLLIPVIMGFLISSTGAMKYERFEMDTSKFGMNCFQEDQLSEFGGEYGEISYYLIDKYENQHRDPGEMVGYLRKGYDEIVVGTDEKTINRALKDVRVIENTIMDREYPSLEMVDAYEDFANIYYDMVLNHYNKGHISANNHHLRNKLVSERLDTKGFKDTVRRAEENGENY